ncbi:MAG: DNA recombination/repair protein RecA [Desulfarculus sp.]|nr:DNA recombination/repair protein RecA [Pseudomonadota bacterium]MBU4599255.1 DNA recombination/repair protein RecA [Pseudomonadota bacterium]MBV1715477.1 DNA recombination/repair protein RecA [Desulfarculus sp.]MBV1739676.1 DNA recombination/repair protein RecA [Desulfarculus sp.]
MADIGKIVAGFRKQVGESYFIVNGEPTGFLSTGWAPLDRAMGGGFAIPKLTVLAGKYSAGKTMLALVAAKQVQAQGGLVVYCNSERAPVATRAAQLGIDITADSWMELAVPVLDSYYKGEGAKVAKTKENLVMGFFDIMTLLLNMIHDADPNRLILVILDTVSTTPTARALQGIAGQALVGNTARVMGQCMPGFNQQMSDLKVAVIFINHLTQKIGQSWGDDTTMVADTQQGHYAVNVVKMWRTKDLEVNKKPVGHEIRARVTKNKITGTRVKDVKFPIYYDTGIPEIAGMVELLAENSTRKGFIELAGKQEGKNAVIDKAASDPALTRALRQEAQELMAKLLIEDKAAPPADAMSPVDDSSNPV